MSSTALHFSFSLQICDQWIHTVLLSYRLLNSDDFNFLTVQGWDFEKSKFKIKWRRKILKFNYFFLLLKHDFVCLYLPYKGPSYQFSKKKKEIDPSVLHVMSCICSRKISVFKLHRTVSSYNNINFGTTLAVSLYNICKFYFNVGSESLLNSVYLFSYFLA